MRTVRSCALFIGTAMAMTVTMLVGCTATGPQTIVMDRFNYSSAIADSWKQQTLLNIVKLRYMDLPVFVDVSSIVAGYSLQTDVHVDGEISSSSRFIGAGAQAVYIDRPTITYSPMTGEAFLRALITPIDPKNIFFMLQSGYAADFILGLTVESINGVRNRSATGGIIREADPEFDHALALLLELQAAGAVGMQVEEDASKGSVAVLIFHTEDISPEIAVKAAEVRHLLRLTTNLPKVVIKYSSMRGAEDELAVNSRSMLQIMGAFASCIAVPESDVTDRSALSAVKHAPEHGVQQLVQIRSSKNRPSNAYAAVRYRDHWFWIDDDDWRTKRALTAVMFFFTLADTGSNDSLPLITIPAQ